VTQLRKALFYVEWADKDKPDEIHVQYNPTEYSIDKGVQLGEVQIPGLDAPLQQFVRGQAEKLTLELFFDTTEHGMGAGAHSVTTETDKIYQLIKIEPKRHAPPILTFIWNDAFPGSSIGGAPAGPAASVAQTISGAVSAAASALGPAIGAAGSVVAAAIGTIGAALGGQRRNGFRCIMESIKQKFTLFSPEGVPLRATLTVTLREYKSLPDQLAQIKAGSPDRTHVHVLQQAETYAAVAQRYYEKPDDWRAIAAENRVDDPRRTTPGQFLCVPPLR
jgi:nucleoid-associated protein YgaU